MVGIIKSGPGKPGPYRGIALPQRRSISVARQHFGRRLWGGGREDLDGVEPGFYQLGQLVTGSALWRRP